MSRAGGTAAGAVRGGGLLARAFCAAFAFCTHSRTCAGRDWGCQGRRRRPEARKRGRKAAAHTWAGVMAGMRPLPRSCRLPGS